MFMAWASQVVDWLIHDHFLLQRCSCKTERAKEIWGTIRSGINGKQASSMHLCFPTYLHETTFSHSSPYMHTYTQALQLIARSLESLALSDEEDLRTLSIFLLKFRGAQLADLISSFATSLHDVSKVSPLSVSLWMGLWNFSPCMHQVPYAIASGGAPSQPAITLEQRNLLKQQLPRPVRPSSLSVLSPPSCWGMVDAAA